MHCLSLDILTGSVEVLACVPIKTFITEWAFLTVLDVLAQYLLLRRTILGECVLLTSFGSTFAPTSTLSTTRIALRPGFRFRFSLRLRLSRRCLSGGSFLSLSSFR